MSGRPVLYFDVGSPFAWLTAERAADVLGVAPVFQPVLLGGLFKLTGRSSWAVGDPARREAGVLDIEQRAQAYGLPAMRWPPHWPGDYLTAMRVATWAQGHGAAEAYALAAMRRGFTQGRDLSLPGEVRAAAADAGFDGDTALEAAADPGVKLALREATQAAFDRGVFGVPTVAVDGELFWGDDRLEEVPKALARAREGEQAAHRSPTEPAP
jgi:2-hydroxychromene-2-carboxylate isomerase